MIWPMSSSRVRRNWESPGSRRRAWGPSISCLHNVTGRPAWLLTPRPRFAILGPSMQSLPRLTLPRLLLRLVGHSPACGAVAVPTSADLGIPATFTEDQAGWILGLAKIDVEEAAKLLGTWTPGRFTAVQAECVQALLALDARDMRL